MHQDIRISTHEDTDPSTTDTTFVFGKSASGHARSTTSKQQHADVRWLDGLPVSLGTAQMAQELRKVNPAVRFAGKNVSVSGNQYVYKSLWVYLPGHDMTMGWIGYGAYAINGNTHKFTVSSRKIKNDKVASWRDQYNMVMSEDVKRAVKNACKFLVPWTDYEIAMQSFGEFHDHAEEPLQEVVGEANKFLAGCALHRVLRMELKNLIQQGATFVTNEFKQAATQFLKAEADAEAEKLRKVGGLYIRVFEQAGRQMASVLTVGRNLRDSNTSLRTTDPTIVLESDMFAQANPDVAAKIAVLTTMAPGTYVPNVGQRVAAQEFWVEVDL